LIPSDLFVSTTSYTYLAIWIFYVMPETLQKEVIREGNGTDKPKAGDVVTMDYTGWLYEKNEPNNRGKV
jgi:hypothetical protein